MKKIIFILVLMITLQISYGQTLKTETEKYKDGVITYQGYEKSETMDFIKHGTFKFVENLKGKYGSWNVLVTGTFKNGLRNGLWTYSIKQIDAENNDGTYTTGTLLYTQIFKDGNPDGLCNYKNTYKTREIICDYYGHCKWGIYSRIENESANIIYKNGKPIGLIKYVINNIPKTLKLNQNGLIAEKSLKIINGAIWTIETFDNGKVTRTIEKMDGSGTILNNELPDSIDFRLDTVGINYLFTSDLRDLFVNDYFNHWGGDKTVTEQGILNRSFGLCIRQNKIRIE